MKSIKLFREYLREEGLYTKVLVNMLEADNMTFAKLERYGTLPNYFAEAFDWEGTPEGVDFWELVDKNWNSFLTIKSPELPQYVYTVLLCDNHSEPSVTIFFTEEDAVCYARYQANLNAVYKEEIKESYMRDEGWCHLYIDYSMEKDNYIRVDKTRLGNDEIINLIKEGV